MTRLAAVVVCAVLGAVAAFINFSLPSNQGCELAGNQLPGYHVSMIGPVSVTQTSHDLLITHNGRPIAPQTVCINTQMIGMSGMGYTNDGKLVAPGRYRVDFQFGMAGDYIGNVVVTRSGSKISIPLKLHVTQPSL